MDYSSAWLNTSLNLSNNPLRILDTISKKKVEKNFLELGRKPSIKQEGGALMEELDRVSAENKRLTGMLTEMCDNYSLLRNHLMDYMRKNPEKELGSSKKRKSDRRSTPAINGTSDSSSTEEECYKKALREESMKTKISRVHVSTEASDTSLVVKDGYQWRKYGQKVTRDNPYPRAYFKCSFAPSCPVKKKVQRSLEDQSVLVATYEGEHNHPNPSQNLQAKSLGCTKSISYVKNPKVLKSELPQEHQFLVEEMATSLTKDPQFIAALVAAISGNSLQKNPTQT